MTEHLKRWIGAKDSDRFGPGQEEDGWGRAPTLFRNGTGNLILAFGSIRATCPVFKQFLSLAFGHLFYFATVPFARVASLPLVAL